MNKTKRAAGTGDEMQSFSYFQWPVSVSLPVAVLVLKTVLRMTVDQEVSFTGLVRSTINTPVDIVFLSISFFVAFLISPRSLAPSIQLGQCIVVLIGLVIVSVITIVLQQRSNKFLDDSSFYTCAATILLSYLISVPVFTYCIAVLVA